MGNILIVETSEEQSASIADALGNLHSVQICHNPQSARDVLDEYTPDALVLGLKDMDGLLFLQELGENRPPVLVYTTCCSDHMAQHIQKLCDYMMYTPCNLFQLADRVSDMIQNNQDDPFVDDNDPILTIMRQLMQRPARYGYQYLISAVQLYARNHMQAITKEIYPALAKEYGTTGKCVEKAIRSAIAQAYEERDDAIWRRYFPKDRNGVVIRPTNKAFLAHIIRHIQEKSRRRA